MEVSVLRRTLMEATLVLCKLRDTASIREALLKLIFSITPADRAAVLIDNCLWERDRGDPEQRVGVRSGIVDRVFKDGGRILSDDHSIVCVPLEAFDNRRGAIYAEASDSDARLDDVARRVGRPPVKRIPSPPPASSSVSAQA